MRPRLPVLLLLVCLASSACAAPGVALRWDQCYGDGGASNRNFACDTNAGTNILVGSFMLANEALVHRGNEMVLDIAAADPQWPTWWAMKNPGTCRLASLTMDFVGLGTNCPDWANGQAAGGIGSYLIGHQGPNTARIQAASLVAITTMDTKADPQRHRLPRRHAGTARDLGQREGVVPVTRG